MQNESVDRTLWEDYKNRHQTASEPQVSYPTWAVDLKAAFGQWLAHLETLRKEAMTKNVLVSSVENLQRRIQHLAEDEIGTLLLSTEDLAEWLYEHRKK